MHMPKDSKNQKKKRTWHKADNIETGIKPEVFLLRYLDSHEEPVKNKGPFYSKETADTELRKYLQDGICSWLVSYNE